MIVDAVGLMKEETSSKKRDSNIYYCRPVNRHITPRCDHGFSRRPALHNSR